MNPNDTPQTIIIPLTRGYSATVDYIDRDLAELKWSADVTKNGIVYARRAFITPDGKEVFKRIHRVILSRILDKELLRSELADHVDGNGLNNTRENIRLASFTDNARNARRQKNNKSGFKGVSWSKAMNKWIAQICVDYKRIAIGFYDTPEEAYAAYCEEAPKQHGKFAKVK